MQPASSPPGVRGLVAASIVARLPSEMLGVGLLVHAQRLTGSFAAAGAVTGVYGIGVGVGGPLLAKLVDRRGQASVLVTGASVTAALLLVIAALPSSTPLAPLIALAAAAGLATPPVGASLRALLPAVLRDPAAVRSAYALEASAVELTYIVGPPLTLCIGALWSTGAALAACGALLLAGTVAFATRPAARIQRTVPSEPELRGRSLRSPAIRTLVLVLIGVGALLGAGEVAIVSAARTLDSPASAAPLFAIWGAGSFIGGMLVTRFGGGARTTAGLALWLGALTAGHLALVPADGNVLTLAAVLLIAGAAIAPTEATVSSMVEHAAPARSMTEAFAWLATAMAVGAAGGAAGAGLVADRYGPTAAFALAGGAGALALLATMLRLTPRYDRTGASLLIRTPSEVPANGQRD